MRRERLADRGKLRGRYRQPQDRLAVEPQWAGIGIDIDVHRSGVALLQSRLDAGSSWATIMPGLLVAGLGVAMPSLNSAGMSAVPPEQSGMAAGALNTARQLGLALGIAVLGSVFTARMGAAGLTDPASATAALGTTMIVAGVVGVTGAALVTVLLGRRRHKAGPAPDRDTSPIAA